MTVTCFGRQVFTRKHLLLELGRVRQGPIADIPAWPAVGRRGPGADLRAYGRRNGRMAARERKRFPFRSPRIRCKGHHAADPMAVCSDPGSVASFTRLRPSSLAR